MSSQPTITLLPFVAPANADDLKRLLEELGYGIRIPRLRGMLEDCYTHWGNILVMLFGQRNLPREYVMPLLHQENRVPVLGLFHGSEWPWDEEIIDYCDDFSCWPCPRQELSVRISRLDRSTESLAGTTDAELAAEFLRFNLVGMSPAFLELLRRIRKIARCDASVVIEGETGTGKELAARAIHYLGERRDFPFIPVNCGALPDSLLENELFGHAQGAFTDAKAVHAGFIARAQGGTLFLDEVDSLSTKAQVTLLRFLQDMIYLPLGGREFAQANVRVVAATNRPLADLVANGTFRQDLYYRLNIISIQIPPLRERDGDVVLLANRLISRYCAQYQHPQRVLDGRTLRWLACYDWPGNVRELESVIHRAFLMDESQILSLSPNDVDSPERRKNRRERRSNEHFDADFRKAKRAAVSDFEGRYLRWVISQTGGNVTRAAARIGKERRALGKLLKKYGIDPGTYRQGARK